MRPNVGVSHKPIDDAQSQAIVCATRELNLVLCHSLNIAPCRSEPGRHEEAKKLQFVVAVVLEASTYYHGNANRSEESLAEKKVHKGRFETPLGTFRTEAITEMCLALAVSSLAFLMSLQNDRATFEPVGRGQTGRLDSEP